MARIAWIALAVLCCGCGVGTDRTSRAPIEKPVVLTLGAPADAGAVEGFAAAVERLSSGRLRIAVKDRRRDGHAEPEAEFIDDVRAGRVDLGAVGSRAWDAAGAPSFRALHAPLLIDSLALEDVVLSGEITAPMLRSLRPLGLAGIGVIPGPLRRPFGVTHPLVAPADFRGLRIGTFESHVAEATMRALGATPVDVPISAPITGLDGIEDHVAAIAGNDYDSHGGYLTADVVLFARPLVLFAGERRFAALTSAQRSVLVRAASLVGHSEVARLSRDERDQAAILCRRGRLQYVSGDPAALRRAVAPVYRELERDPATSAALRAIEELKGTRPQPTDPVPTCAATATSPAPATARSPFDGVYRMVTPIERDSRGDPQPVPENYGVWNFVFTRGRFAITQELGPACTWGYGTYKVIDNRVQWRFTDGGGIAPNQANNTPGEEFVFRWNRYRDTLTLRRSPGDSSPINFYLRPWRQITTAPTRRYLSTRCPPPANALP